MRFLIAACSILCVACDPGVDKPVPPDLTALVARYEAPSGTLDDTTSVGVRDAVAAVIDQINALGIADRINEATQAFRDGMASEPQAETMGDVEVEGGTIRVEGEAFVELTRTCDGWGDEPIADAANGLLRLNVNLTDLAIDPHVWFSAEDCRYREGDIGVELGQGTRRDVGDLRLFVGDNLDATQLGLAPYLVDVDARAALNADIGGVSANANFDFRVLIDPAGFEVRVAVQDGDLVASFVDDVIVRIRAANGTFDCDESGLCVNEDGLAVSL